MDQLLDKMRLSVLEGDETVAVLLAEKALAAGMDLKEVMDEGFLKGIQEAGALYEDGEYFLPDLVCSAEAMKSALAVLDVELKKPTSGIVSKGKVILATVQGDVHDIGKIIVGAMLTASGYDVVDLGADVPNDTVLSASEVEKADIIGLSALLTTTMEEQRNIIHRLEESGRRQSHKVIVGGAPVTHSWADTIGADGTADDAIGTVSLVDQLMK